MSEDGSELSPLSARDLAKSLMADVDTDSIFRESQEERRLLLKEEEDRFRDENPQFLEGLLELGRGKPDFKDFKDGVLWTHKLLREAAESDDVELPNVTEHHLKSYQAELFLKGQFNKYIIDDSLQEIEEQDPKFGDAINEVPTISPAFNRGVVYTYGAIKRAEADPYEGASCPIIPQISESLPGTAA